ncbi:protein boule-like [Salarias fasciatus]|uniref:protein boule-like n=1 Tax=Salarias fasciatus TaxID=181472 RepID=UPI001176A3D7|nr:protein boule-like [Salarias fasciatus]
MVGSFVIFLFSSCEWQNSSGSTDPPPGEKHSIPLGGHFSALGHVVPNRIFVGGINFRVHENELRHFFSQYGAIKDVKIVTHRTGMSKGYGFVTFESQEDASKLLNSANGICLKDKKLSIGQAFKKHRTSAQMRSSFMAGPEAARPHHFSHGTLYLTTSTGFPYTFHNGVAYFHSPAAPHWPAGTRPQPAPAESMMGYCLQSADSVALHQSHQPQASYQPAPSACQLHQPELPPATLMYSQQSEYLYQPVDEASFQYPVPVMEETPAEIPAVPLFYPGLTPFALQHDPGKNLFVPSLIHRKAKYRRIVHHKSHFLREPPELPDAAMFHSNM